MALTLDHRALPEELREKMKHGKRPEPPKPPEGQEIFCLPEPQLQWLPELRRTEQELGGVPVYSACFDGPRKDYVFFHIHGGGFCGGNQVSAYCLMDRLSRQWRIDSYSVLYSLVPKAFAPTQVEQCLQAYRGLLERGYEKVILAGESAGANLAIALTLELKRLGLPLPEVVISASAPLDFTGNLDRGESDQGHEEELGDLYRAELSAADPRVSPYYGDFDGFPPLLLQAGELETLRYDSEALAEKLRDADCDCTLSIWEGGEHAFGIDPGDSWIHLQARQQILDFIKANCPGL